MSLLLAFSLMASLSAFLVVYPYLIYPLILRVLPKRACRPSSSQAKADISVSLLFCAYNEEKCLSGKLANLRAIKGLYPDLNILAYSDASTDRTNEMLADATDILTPVLGKQRKGKVAGMRRLVSMSDSDVVIFSDANVLIDPRYIQRLVDYFSIQNVDCVAATLVYDVDDHAVSDTERVGGLYWRLEEHIKKLESETGSTMGADGALFARRRIGYPHLADHFVDDMAASLSVLFNGGRCVSAPDVVAHEKMATSTDDEFRRKRRIACGSMATYRYLLPKIRQLPWIDRFKFFSHKTLRWWGASFMFGTLLSLQLLAIELGYGLPALLTMLAVLLAVYVFGSRGLPVFGTVLEIARAMVATNLGILEYYLGKVYVTWTPPKSSREKV